MTEGKRCARVCPTSVCTQHLSPAETEKGEVASAWGNVIYFVFYLTPPFLRQDLTTQHWLYWNLIYIGQAGTELTEIQPPLLPEGWYQRCVPLILLLVCLYTWGCRCPQRPKEATGLCPFLGVHRFYRYTFQMAGENLNVKLVLEFSPTF